MPLALSLSQLERSSAGQNFANISSLRAWTGLTSLVISIMMVAERPRVVLKLHEWFSPNLNQSGAEHWA